MSVFLDDMRKQLQEATSEYDNAKENVALAQKVMDEAMNRQLALGIAIAFYEKFAKEENNVVS